MKFFITIFQDFFTTPYFTGTKQQRYRRQLIYENTGTKAENIGITESDTKNHSNSRGMKYLMLVIPQKVEVEQDGITPKKAYLVVNYDITYEYSDGIEVFYEDEQEINLGVEDGVLKSGGEWEDPLYLDVYAQWKPSTDTKVTVNYYLKDLDVDNNVLIDSTTEYAT